ncbi:MAG: STAS domain-containing protein [Candidatus Krumholzibacteria bacterium]|nr:STAS domain-containing protein [Candidatus Krumholzibacteria bacterium]
MEDFSVGIKAVKSDDAVILSPRGVIDSSTTPVLESHLNAEMANGRNRIVVDMSKVEFMNSSGIGVLLGTVSTLRERGGDLILMKVPEPIMELFDLIALADYFVVIDKIEELPKHAQRHR